MYGTRKLTGPVERPSSKTYRRAAFLSCTLFKSALSSYQSSERCEKGVVEVVRRTPDPAGELCCLSLTASYLASTDLKHRIIRAVIYRKVVKQQQ